MPSRVAELAQIMSDAVHDGILPRSPCSRRTSPGQGRQRPYVATTEQVSTRATIEAVFATRPTEQGLNLRGSW
jgi:hypothetical protein